VWYVQGREVRAGLWWGNLRERVPLERPSRRWEGNIKMDLQEIGRGVDWNDLAQDRDKWRSCVNTVINAWVP
jgi:hypothetical protein